jgi:hypothetical protein
VDNRPKAAATSIPPDDPARDLTLVGPNEDDKLRHVALAGDIYTILLTGDDTAGKFCLQLDEAATATMMAKAKELARQYATELL